jgi:N-acetylglucosaminyldiphosphoundecaprenol N-acetyl-beta-D-mannosaminyltransferase
VASGAGIVLVGRGCPRQERWVADHLDRIPCAMLAVGAAFDYLAGTLNRPPHWMQRIGLEWLHRLSQEPRRLWKRYTVTNTQFIGRFLVLWGRTKFARLRSIRAK